MTLAQARFVLDRHEMQSRDSAKPGHIDAKAEYVRDGVVSFEWESIPLNLGAIRDWLGY